MKYLILILAITVMFSVQALSVCNGNGNAYYTLVESDGISNILTSTERVLVIGKPTSSPLVNIGSWAGNSQDQYKCRTKYSGGTWVQDARYLGSFTMDLRSTVASAETSPAIDRRVRMPKNQAFRSDKLPINGDKFFLIEPIDDSGSGICMDDSGGWWAKTCLCVNADCT